MARKSSGDYEGWILRTITESEDLIALRSEVEFARVMSRKHYAFHKRAVTGTQQGQFQVMYQDRVKQIFQNFGVRAANPTRYRDRFGHFTTRDAAGDKRPVRSYTVREYSAEGGRRISTNKFEERFAKYRDSRISELKEEQKRERRGKD